MLVAGNSLCVFVHGFEPYFFVEAPTGFGPDDCVSLSNALNVSSWPRPAQFARYLLSCGMLTTCYSSEQAKKEIHVAPACNPITAPQQQAGLK